MKIILIILTLVVTAIAPVAVYASDISEAQYYGIITVSNNATTANTTIATACAIDSDAMINGLYLDSGLSDGAIRSTSGSDIAFMPGYDSNDWIMYVPTIAGNAQLNYILYTANTTGGKYCYFPGAATGFTIADALGLELGDNYTVEIKGLFLTDRNTYYPLAKGNAFGIRYDPSNEIAVIVNSNEVLTVSDVEPGEYTITISDNTVNQTIEIDGVLMDSTASVWTVPNTVDVWLAGYNATMLYIEYLNIEIDGVQKCYIEWEYSADTFTDQSGNSNDATVVSYRTATSDPDITAELVDFLPVAEAKAPAFALDSAPPFIGTTANITGTFGTTPETGTFPLAGVITAVAAATSTPPQLPLLIIVGFITLAISLSISYAMRRYGPSSLIVKIGVISALLLIFVAIANLGIDFWMVLVFIVLSAAIAFASKQLGWT